MATLALGIAGAAIGTGVASAAGLAASWTFLGLSAAAWGWTIGSALGSYLFAPDSPDIEGARLGDLKIDSAGYGGAIPRVYGNMRLPGNLIWATEKLEVEETEDIGGKGSLFGGGGQQLTQYKYFLNACFGVCEGAHCVRRIWANGQVIWDNSTLDWQDSYTRAIWDEDENAWVQETVFYNSSSKYNDYIRIYPGASGRSSGPSYSGRAGRRRCACISTFDACRIRRTTARTMEWRNAEFSFRGERERGDGHCREYCAYQTYRREPRLRRRRDAERTILFH